jgi:hypothetical protein
MARLCMDQTGMGEKPVEDAQRRYGSSRVEGVLFTGPNKLTLATRGKEAFEDRKIRIPEGDVPLRADLHKLKKVSGPTGAPRFVAEQFAGGDRLSVHTVFAGHALEIQYENPLRLSYPAYRILSVEVNGQEHAVTAGGDEVVFARQEVIAWPETTRLIVRLGRQEN